MFVNLLVLATAAALATCEKGNQHEWDLAVVINDQIQLLKANGSLVGSTVPQFIRLKALTFDNVRHQFVVSDMDQENDTIFIVQLTKETDSIPIVEDLPDDVQGLSIDPITDTLFWTDSLRRSINSVSLNTTNFHPIKLLQLPNQSPQDITVDICNRYIYWTNADHAVPSIERAKLDGSSRETIIETDLNLPSGIIIDYSKRRLYWADKGEGIYFRIESSNLDGTDRELVYEGTHGKPYGLAVDSSAIYWSDTLDNSLWKKLKTPNSVPFKIKEFLEPPMGLIAKNLAIKSLPECQALEEAIQLAEQVQEVFENNTEIQIDSCLNGGELVNGTCRCRRGFTGSYCEIWVCHNFCVHGGCSYSKTGYPVCRCSKGFGGTRCEKPLCDGYCLNGGTCYIKSENAKFGKCRCPQGYTGSRCEKNLDLNELCQIYCKQETLISIENSFLCQCNGERPTRNITADSFVDRQDLVSKLKDPYFDVLLGLVFFCFVLIIILTVRLSTVKNRRPRIKKRIIVNKNVTPLTYRPQATEQCEITIENCCNMNVCETPCFEPPKLRSFQKNEDKKKLLSSMENGEDLY